MEKKEALRIKDVDHLYRILIKRFVSLYLITIPLSVEVALATEGPLLTHILAQGSPRDEEGVHRGRDLVFPHFDDPRI